MASVRNALVRVTRAWRALAPDQRLAAAAALALLVTMVLPWYEKNYASRNALRSASLSAFGVFSWVEAAIFLVAAGVLAMLFFRAERRAFHLPGGDGTVIFGAGLWATFLFLWRVFDRPGVHDRAATVGIQWGFFFAFLASGALTYAGWRMRTVARAEPTALQDPTTKVEPTPPPTAATLPGAARRRRRAGAAGRARSVPEGPTQIAGQLSFEERDDEPARPAAPGEIPPAQPRDRR